MDNNHLLIEADSKMLDARPRTEVAKAYFHNNATESPLLRLPPEICNRTYTYTLSDRNTWYHLDLSTFRPFNAGSYSLEEGHCFDEEPPALNTVGGGDS
ncbi:hypothetical protein E8E11_007703 [Didymella keratinophila]|nr:hypothetical protein E8E11_007703 [Didymella keratinophila]